MKVQFKDLKKMRNYINEQTGERIKNKEFRNLLKMMKKRAKDLNKDKKLCEWLEYGFFNEDDLFINGEKYIIQTLMYIVENNNNYIFKFDLDYTEKIHSFRQLELKGGRV